MESYANDLFDDEFGEVDDVAHNLGSGKFMLLGPAPLTIPRGANGDGDESGDDVNEDTCKMF